MSDGILKDAFDKLEHVHQLVLTDFMENFYHEGHKAKRLIVCAILNSYDLISPVTLKMRYSTSIDGNVFITRNITPGSFDESFDYRMHISHVQGIKAFDIGAFKNDNLRSENIKEVSIHKEAENTMSVVITYVRVEGIDDIVEEFKN